MGVEVLSVEDVSKMLNVSSITVYRLAKEGRMPCRKVGRVWRFNRDIIANWLAGNIWEERLDAFLSKIWARTRDISSSSVKKEVSLAIEEIRKGAK